MSTESIIQGNFDGVLFIGDPHVSSRRPGRRTDDYLSSVLGKLAEAAEVARANNLLPVITGDLIHRENEDSTQLVHRLLRVLKQFHVAPVDVEGNHGKVQARLGVGDIELLLHDAGVLRVVSDVRLFADITVKGKRMQLFSCPHGFELPEDLALLGAAEDAMRVLVTHHDLAFENDYPGSKPLMEIRNCEVAVNGHMHKTSPPVVAGSTVWHCPGNIEPLSIDVRDHKPAVWTLSTDTSPLHIDGLTPHYLQHNKECFNLIGLQIAEMDGTKAVEAMRVQGIDALTGEPMTEAVPLPDVPLFLAELQAQDETNLERTDDASVFEEDVEATLAEGSASEATQLLMRTLVARVRARAA